MNKRTLRKIKNKRCVDKKVKRKTSKKTHKKQHGGGGDMNTILLNLLSEEICPLLTNH